MKTLLTPTPLSSEKEKIVNNIKKYLAWEWWNKLPIPQKFNILYEHGIRNTPLSDTSVINLWKIKNCLTEEDIDNMIFEKNT